MINHNFRSETSNTPDLSEQIVEFANIGTFFFGANNDIYIRTTISEPNDVSDWMQIYPELSINHYVFSDGINTFNVDSSDNVTIVTENNLYLLEISPLTFTINSTYLSGTINPSFPPPKPSLKWFYINTTDSTFWIWNNTWTNITSGGGITDNLDGTYTGDGITWTGTDDQTALEVVSPTPKLGNTVLWNILNSITTNTKLPIAQFEIYDQVGIKTSVASVSSGLTLSYLWSVTPSTGVTITANTASTTDITFPDVGKYEITLQVTDGVGYTHTTKKQIIIDRTIYVNGSDSQYKLFTLLADVYSWIGSNDNSNAVLYTIVTNGVISIAAHITNVNLAKLVILPTTTFSGNSWYIDFTGNNTYYMHGYGSCNIKNTIRTNISNGATLYLDNYWQEGNAGIQLNNSSGFCYLYLNNCLFTAGNFLTYVNGNFARITNTQYIQGSNRALQLNNATCVLEMYNSQLMSISGNTATFCELTIGTAYIINSQISNFRVSVSTAARVIELGFANAACAWYLHNNAIEYDGDAGTLTYPGAAQSPALRLVGTNASSKAHISNCNFVSEQLGLTIDDLLDPNVLFANCFISGEDYSIYREVQATDTLAAWINAKVYNTVLHRQHTAITYATPTATLTGDNIQV